MRTTPGSTLANPEQRIADLERQLAEREAELAEARKRETATAEVLQVINSSPGDFAPVFDAILDKAHRLCGAAMGSLGIFDGDTWRAVVQRGYREPLASVLRQPSRWPDNPLQQELIDGAPLVHVADLAQLDLPIARANVAAGVRALLVVALRKDDAFLGTISIARHEPRPFSDKEIALLQSFAAQAVIAIENARLINETREALEQQTATAEVLRVINSSPGDLARVFEAMLEKAMRLCDVTFGLFHSYDGEFFRATAVCGVPPQLAEFFHEPFRAGRGFATRQLVAGESIVHIADITAIEPSPGIRATSELGGGRTAIWVALRKEETLLGFISMYRQEVRPFSDKQIALLQNFAAQAVIAMENARLLTETREALEQQTATAEVLQVINSSPGDLAPVFDAILENAHHLCDIESGALLLHEGEKFRAVATRGYPEEVDQSLRQPYALGPNSPVQALLNGEPLAEIPDVIAHQAEAPNPRAEAAIAHGMRSVVFVPLRRDSLLLGMISAARKEAGPFLAKEIGLLQNFAAQAVIAMENARLLTETREALEQQTATAEVLQVINSSPGDLAPVFDAMLERATRLCEASSGLMWTTVGERFQAVATRGMSTEFVEFLRDPDNQPRMVASNLPIGRVVRGEPLVHVLNLMADEFTHEPPALRKLVELGGFRTILALPLRNDSALLGAFVVGRREVRPFTAKQIALLQNFAAQAVIAMENARLLTETREALEQQTATAEVLQVINSSPGDLAPVFDAILDKAHTLCGAEHGALTTFDGEMFRARLHVACRNRLQNCCAAASGLCPAVLPSRCYAASAASISSIWRRLWQRAHRQPPVYFSCPLTSPALARCCWCRYARMAHCSVTLPATAKKSDRSPTSRLSCCRISRRRRLSRCRMRG